MPINDNEIDAMASDTALTESCMSTNIADQKNICLLCIVAIYFIKQVWNTISHVGIPTACLKFHQKDTKFNWIFSLRMKLSLSLLFGKELLPNQYPYEDFKVHRIGERARTL